MKLDDVVDELAIVNVLLLVYGIGCICLKANEVIRRWWVQPHLTEIERNVKGAYNVTFCYFKLQNHEEFYNFTRMTVHQFDGLLKLVKPHLKSNKRSIRKSLGAELKLAAFLNYAAVGANVRQQACFFRIGRSTMYRIIQDVSKAILDGLQEKYLEFPTREQWEVIADNYQHAWKLPNCLGALDGKHIRLRCPPHSGSLYYNYNKFYSVVLMAACDAFGRFTWLNCGNYGHLNDANIFNSSDLGMALARNEIPLPAPKELPNFLGKKLPFFFLGDGIFGLKNYLMTPYARSSRLKFYERIYNYRHARARRVIECAFGTLVSKWHILQKPINFAIHINDQLVMSIACIHNFLITSELSVPENQKNYLNVWKDPPTGLFYERAFYNNDVMVEENGNIDEDDLDLLTEEFFDDEREPQGEENVEMPEEIAFDEGNTVERVSVDNSSNPHDFLEEALDNNDWADMEIDDRDFIIGNFIQRNAADEEAMEGEIINLMNIEENEDLSELRPIIIRKHLTEYFISKEGSVPYQWQNI